MSEKVFDEFIRQKVNDHASAVPADMWERIHAGSKKRRGLGWWQNPIAALFIGVLIIGGGWGIYAGLENNAVENEITDTKQNMVELKQPIHNIPSEKNQNGNNTTENLSGTNLQNSNATLVNSNSENNNTNHSKAEINRNPSAGIQLNNEKVSASKLESANSKISRKIDQSSIIKTRDALTHKSGVSSNTEESAGLHLQDFNQVIQNALLQIAASPKNINQKKLNEKLLKDHKFYGFTECPSAYGSGRNDWYLEAYVSPDYAFKTTTKGNLPESYFAKKDSTEHFQSAFTAGVRVSKNMGENLMLKTGLQYTQINEKFSLRTENERRLITVVTIRTIIRSPGDTLVVSDTSMVEQIGYRVKTTHNKYRSLDVPLILGYEWGNENWRGSVNAGVILNLRSWQQGEMLDTSYMAVSFQKSSAQTFKQNIGLGLYAGFSIIKPINNQVEIFAEPYFRYNISSMNQSKSLFDQRFHSAGLNLGVRYKLNNSRQR